ncbi:MAG: type IV toxin-antitoxin system AbiEi family antitoxin domain-containing protein [Oligoflexales bacterium]
MNDQSPRLGKFRTQFLAWIQLRQKSQVETGEVAAALGLSAKQERELLSRMARQGLIVRLRRGLYMVPPRIPPGGKWSPGEYKLVDTLMADANATYQLGGPIAFHQYGFDQQVPNSITVYNNKISGQRVIGGTHFAFIKVPLKRLGGHECRKLPGGGEIIMASMPRTLFDAVYDWDRYNTLPRAYRWISAKKDDHKTIKELVRLALKHGNVGTTRRLGYVLNKLKVSRRITNKLHAALPKSSSLVPLVPTKQSRGLIDRNWGIIDNDND